MADGQDIQKDPRVYFAAERTFLAWIRTGLGLMGVGFAVSRFGLFLREMRATETHLPVQATGFSVIAGVGLVALGVVVLVASVLQHLASVRALQAGSWSPGPSRNAVILALLLAAIGVVMGAYLVVLR